MVINGWIAEPMCHRPEAFMTACAKCDPVGTVVWDLEQSNQVCATLSPHTETTTKGEGERNFSFELKMIPFALQSKGLDIYAFPSLYFTSFLKGARAQSTTVQKQKLGLEGIWGWIKWIVLTLRETCGQNVGCRLFENNEWELIVREGKHDLRTSRSRCCSFKRDSFVEIAVNGPKVCVGWLICCFCFFDCSLVHQKLYTAISEQDLLLDKSTTCWYYCLS